MLQNVYNHCQAVQHCRSCCQSIHAYYAFSNRQQHWLRPVLSILLFLNSELIDEIHNRITPQAQGQTATEL